MQTSGWKFWRKYFDIDIVISEGGKSKSTNTSIIVMKHHNNIVGSLEREVNQ